MHDPESIWNCDCKPRPTILRVKTIDHAYCIVCNHEWSLSDNLEHVLITDPIVSKFLNRVIFKI